MTRRPFAPPVYAGICIAALHASLASAGGPTFSDQTTQAGVIAVHDNQFINRFLAGGAVGDFDGDGFQDIFVPSSGASPDKLFLNNGDGTFTDKASQWGLTDSHMGTAASVGDYNNDGRLDIFVTSMGPQGVSTPGMHRLYCNEPNQRFVNKATGAGVNLSSLAQADGFGAAWGDYDLDGDLDLAVSGWGSPADGNRLFRNNGDGTFTDARSVAQLTSLPEIKGFAPRFVDMNGDRYPELIWIGDFTTSAYYINDGDGTFTDFTGQSGTGLAGTEMGHTVADFNHDGLFDFYVTTISNNKLYINNGGHTFTERAAQAGVVNTGWGWGTVAVDIDNDTLVDLVVTTQSSRQYVFHNTSADARVNLTFAEIGAASGLVSSVSGRGLANLDYDNDGDQDIVIFPNNGPVRLFRNDATGPDARWLRVFLDSGSAADIAPNGVGSTVEVVHGGESYINRVDGGSNYLSQSEMAAHFGLGASDSVDELHVRWNNGLVTTVPNVAADQIVTITPAGLLHGDTDGNGVISLRDASRYVDCVTGPAAETNLIGCSVFDFDGDGDVDLADLAGLQRDFATP